MGWLDDIVTKAQDSADKAYADQPGYQDHGDAMRHVLASGQLAQKVGRYPALGLMAAHEVLGGDVSAAGRTDSAMDLRNNRIGAEIGSSTGSFEELYAQAKARVAEARTQNQGLSSAVMDGDPKTMAPAIIKDRRPAFDPAKYDTRLTSDQEAGFTQWKKVHAPRDSGHDYDNRAAYLADMEGVLPAKAANGHGTDMFKKPNHPTFSTGSRYHGKDGEEGGVWGTTRDGKTTFTPGKTNTKYQSKRELEEYFKRVEPDAKLVWPSRKGLATN